MGPAFERKWKYAVLALKIGWPLIIVESLDSIVSITDTFFVSRLGDDAIAGVGLSSYLMWFLGVFGALYYVGVLVLVSQAIGAGNWGKATKVLRESLGATILLAIPLSLAGSLYAGSLVEFLGGKNSILQLGQEYLEIRVMALPLWFTLLVYDAAFRGTGITKPLVISSLTSALLNVILDPILIYGLFNLPALGVRGAAIASFGAIVAGVVVNGLLIRKYLGINPLPTIPRSEAVYSARIGFPALIERVVFAGGNNLYMKSVSVCGAKAIAAHTIGVRIESIAYMPAFAISTAASSIIGQLVGSGKKGEARRAGFEIAAISGIIMTIIGLILIITSPYAPLAFTKEDETVKMAMIYLILAGLSEPGLGIVMTLGGSIRGAGETRVPTIINLFSLYAARIVPSYIFAGRIVLLNTCPMIQWIFMDIDILLRTILFIYVYYRFIHSMAKKLV